MITGKLGGRLGTLNDEGRQLLERLRSAKDQIIRDYEGLNYAAVVRTVAALADEANRYVEVKQPWTTIKTDAEATRATLTAVMNAVKTLTIYLKPILPKFAQKIEKLLNVEPLTFAQVDATLENSAIGVFERLIRDA